MAANAVRISPKRKKEDCALLLTWIHTCLILTEMGDIVYVNVIWEQYHIQQEETIIISYL